MDNFLDSVAFAAIMTLRDDLKEQEKSKTANIKQYNSERNLPVNFEITDKDPSNGYLRLCKIAESLFKAADITEVLPSEIIPAMLCDVFYEAIKDSENSVEQKISAYEHAKHYCLILTDFTGEMLFATRNNTVVSLAGQLLDVGLQLILTASQKEDRVADGLGFISAFAELVNCAEESVCNKYKDFKFNEKPATIIFEKAQVLTNEQMHAMEAEDPTLKSSPKEQTKFDRVNNALNAARNLMNASNMGKAAEKYREVLDIDPQNWEAKFYSEFCSVAVTSPSMVRPEYIPDKAQKIIRAAEIAIPLSKSQIYTRTDILKALSNIAQSLGRQATHWYIATMNHYKSFPNNRSAKSEKIQCVKSIMRMLFTVGDVIERYYSDDRDICAATAYACWSLGITCYESTNMPQPPGTYEHWIKMKKYDPTCHCNKTISPSGDGGYIPPSNISAGNSNANRSSSGNSSSGNSGNHTPATNSSTSSGGCYIATCVYGNYDCPPVWTLRRFRDMRLAKTMPGRAFIRFYYFLSPKMVLLFGKTRWFRKGLRFILDRFVDKLQKDGFEASPYKDEL